MVFLAAICIDNCAALAEITVTRRRHRGGAVQNRVHLDRLPPLHKKWAAYSAALLLF